MRGQLAKERQLDRGVIGESAALSRREYLAAQYEAVVVVHVGIGEEVLKTESRYVELGLYDALAFGVGQDCGIGPLSEEQSQGAEQDGLASSRLAGDSHKTAPEGNVRLPNKGVVLYVEGG